MTNRVAWIISLAILVALLVLVAVTVNRLGELQRDTILIERPTPVTTVVLRA